MTLANIALEPSARGCVAGAPRLSAKR